MKKILITLLAVTLLTGVSYAQWRVVDQMELCAVKACSLGGINATFVSGNHQKARMKTDPITFTVPVGDKLYSIPATRAFLEMSSSKADGDTVLVFFYGVGPGGKNDTTWACLDTMSLKAVANTSAIIQITPTINWGLSNVSTVNSRGVLPYQGRFMIAQGDSGNDLQFPYHGLYSDTNICKFRVYLIADPAIGQAQ